MCSRKLEGECSPEQPGPTFEETGYFCNQYGVMIIIDLLSLRLIFIEIQVVRAGRIAPVSRWTQYVPSCSLVVVSVTRPALVRAGWPLDTCVTSK